jgi:hypothetical protein
LALIRIYPNPASDMIQVDASSLQSKSIQFSLLDISGRNVFEKNISGGTVHTIQIRELGLSSGVYQSVISYGNTRKTSKIIITEP